MHICQHSHHNHINRKSFLITTFQILYSIKQPLHSGKCNCEQQTTTKKMMAMMIWSNNIQKLKNSPPNKYKRKSCEPSHQKEKILVSTHIKDLPTFTL